VTATTGAASSLLEEEAFVRDVIWPLLAGSSARRRVADLGVTVHRRRPDGRLVVEYRTGRTRIFAKLYPDASSGAAAFSVHRALWSAGLCAPSPHRVPEPLAYLADHRVLLLGPAAGVQLGRTARPPNLADLRRTARWLARLHSSRVDLGVTEDDAEGVLRLARRAVTAAAVRPEIEEVARTLLETLSVRYARCGGSERAPTHGRFSLEHVYASSRHVTVVDLDRAAIADPAKDVGELLHRLRWRAGRRDRAPAEVEDASAAFVRQYRRHSPHGLVGLEYHWSFSVVRTLLMLASTRTPGKGWDERSAFLLGELDRIPARVAALLEPQGVSRSRRSMSTAPATSTSTAASATTGVPTASTPFWSGDEPTSQNGDRKRNGSSQPASPCSPLTR
jgi:hypothetical protein